MRLALPLQWPAFASVASAYAGSQGNEMSSATSKMFCSIATPPAQLLIFRWLLLCTVDWLPLVEARSRTQGSSGY
uniref:Uncharacterized protein n=1 Tax=Anopheles braziliensis TaxID=58242 RepID=A0A2M3ZLP5_9DIPT